MKIKLDENLPVSLKFVLNGLGHDVHTTLDEGMAGQPDPKIWETAQHERRFLITQDLDFSDARRFVPGTHHGIFLVRLHSPSRLALCKRIEEIFRTENVDEWISCFVVATERKLRVRKPSSTR